MNQEQQKGFVLILVVVVIVLIGTAMFVLTSNAQSMLFEANRAYVRAIERNLAASGLAWAERNVKNQNRETFGKGVELDAANMNAAGSTLTVTVDIPTDKEVQVRINASCSRGKHTVRHDKNYRIKL